jgi:hypothetical protein
MGSYFIFPYYIILFYIKNPFEICTLENMHLLYYKTQLLLFFYFFCLGFFFTNALIIERQNRITCHLLAVTIILLIMINALIC